MELMILVKGTMLNIVIIKYYFIKIFNSNWNRSFSFT